MEITRDIMTALLKWKQRQERKPLIIQGTRQIGKTWVMQKFGEEHWLFRGFLNSANVVVPISFAEYIVKSLRHLFKVSANHQIAL